MATGQLNPKNSSFSKKKAPKTICTGANAENIADLPEFDPAAYLAINHDMAGIIDEPLQAACHYLEYGLGEGFDGEHDTIDPAWVRDTYKIEVSDADPESGYVIRDALQQLFKKRKSPLKIELQQADHWGLLGISGVKMTQIFDHEYYHAVASRAGMAPKDHDRRTFIAHFLSVGMDAVLPIYRDHNFDADFYADLMPETRLAADFPLSDVKSLQSLPVSVPYGHWIKRGTRAGLAANFKTCAEHSFGQAVPDALLDGALTFYEIDDIVFDTAHVPPSLESYAGQIDEGHYAAMACGVPLFEHAMTLCDYGIASTATIKTLMETKVRTGQVFEHHNALSRMHLAAVKQDQAENGERKKGAPLVLFYGSGTKAHKEDFHDILEPALAETVRRYGKKVEIRLIGHFGDFKHLNMKKDPVKLIKPMWDFDEYCSRVAEADINLSVLTASLLTDAKSEIKSMEAGMFGIPSVVSATATHRETIVDGETGFLAQTTKDFITALDRLVSDDGLRTTIGEAARAKIMATYGVAQMGQNLRNVCENLRPVVAPKPRLMVVNVCFPPQSIGGATRVVHDNIKIIADQYGDKYEIDVVCTLEGGSTPYNIDTYAIDGVRVWAITAPDLDGGNMQTRNPQMGEVFGNLVDRMAPDLVHFHCSQRLSVSAVEAVRYRDIPYLITLHDGWWISPNQSLINDKDIARYYDYRAEAKDNLPARAQTLARSLRGATKLLAVSPQFVEIYESCGLTNVAVNENGVSPLIAVDRTPSLSDPARYLASAEAPPVLRRA